MNRTMWPQDRSKSTSQRAEQPPTCAPVNSPDLLLAGLDPAICIPIARKPGLGAALRSAGEVMSPSAEPYRARSLPTRTCPP